MLLVSDLPSKHRRRLKEGCDGQDPSIKGGATRATEALREPHGQSTVCHRLDGRCKRWWPVGR
jgi:hypothetical protein